MRIQIDVDEENMTNHLDLFLGEKLKKYKLEKTTLVKDREIKAELPVNFVDSVLVNQEVNYFSIEIDNLDDLLSLQNDLGFGIMVQNYSYLPYVTIEKDKRVISCKMLKSPSLVILSSKYTGSIEQ